MLENFSLIDIKPSAAVYNATSIVCLFRAYQTLKTLNYFDLQQEEKLNEIQGNLECALEQYGEKIEKKVHEDPLASLERTLKALKFLQFFPNSSKQEKQRFSDTDDFSRLYYRNF